jgi:hypothetical protein
MTTPGPHEAALLAKVEDAKKRDVEDRWADELLQAMSQHQIEVLERAINRRLHSDDE